jgi:hypothetical protein
MALLLLTRSVDPRNEYMSTPRHDIAIPQRTQSSLLVAGRSPKKQLPEKGSFESVEQQLVN